MAALWLVIVVVACFHWQRPAAAWAPPKHSVRMTSEYFSSEKSHVKAARRREHNSVLSCSPGRDECSCHDDHGEFDVFYRARGICRDDDEDDPLSWADRMEVPSWSTTTSSNDSASTKSTEILPTMANSTFPDDSSSSTQKRINRRRHFLSAMGGGALAIASTLAMTRTPSAVAASLANEGISSSQGTNWRSTTGGLPVPFSSVRKYKSVTLSNGLRVLLVSDKQQRDFCSAALSIGGAGQFSDPDNVPGLAHLCEHMVLSVTEFKRANTVGRAQDFEDWMSSRDGASNGYTAYDNVCFHYSMVGRGGPTTTTGYFQEALERFAGLFQEENVLRVFASGDTLRREIRRVNSELKLDSPATQSFFLTKAFVNSEHPFSRFGLGSTDSLEVKPREAGINVSDQLARFFRRFYQPKQAVLVVVGSQEINTLLRWVSPFSTALSKQQPMEESPTMLRNRKLSEPFQREELPPRERYFPGRFFQGGNKLKHLVLAREQQTAGAVDNTERLTFEWILNFDYTSALREGGQVTTATQMAFMMSQILSRRGPGSLYFFLLRRGWVPKGSIGVPKLSVPVEVSGFQMIKLEILLTLEGFINRSAVVAAFYDSLDGFRASRELVTQWAVIAKLFGYALANRPPDNVELSQDTHIYGVDPVWSIGEGNWYRFPSPEDRSAMRDLVKIFSNTLDSIRDPDSAVIIATAGPKALAETALPPISSTKWNVEPISGGRFLYDDMLGIASRVEELVLTRIVNREELLKPVFNPLVPLTLRSTRMSNSEEYSVGNLQQGRNRGMQRFKLDPVFALQGDWLVLFPETSKLPLPRGPPESLFRSAFVLQLLSARPARAGPRGAAQAELWKISLEQDLQDLAESGALGALAYDISFNNYGIRIAFLGISQNLSSYARRLIRRLVRHSDTLLSGDEYFRRATYDAAVSEINRARGVSPQRRRQLVSSIRRSSAYEASVEGLAFLRSCEGAVCFGQGDVGSQKEVLDLVLQLKDILDKALGPSPAKSSSRRPAVPDISEISYPAVWKPHSSPCSITGVPLIADACGRIKR